MFGYFRFNPKYATNKTKRIYKNYYCGTCFALEYTYGEKARLLLSYDVVILGLLAKIYDDPDHEKMTCFFNKNDKKQFIDNPRWKILATINILLMKAKIDDDINDESSLKARIGNAVYSNTIKKAVESYPNLAEIVDAGYKKMYQLEKSHADVLSICDAFANMMNLLMKEAYNLDQSMQDILSVLARWLYFIDQLDDYDDDSKERKFNPLLIADVSKTDYVLNHSDILFSYLSNLTNQFDRLKATLDRNIPEEAIIFSLLNESLPSTTVMVINGTELPKLNHTKKSFEWK